MKKSEIIAQMSATIFAKFLNDRKINEMRWGELFSLEIRSVESALRLYDLAESTTPMTQDTIDKLWDDGIRV